MSPTTCIIFALILLFAVMNIEAGNFFLGSRYGRSVQERRGRIPRADRFFLGSRYGKRSLDYAATSSSAEESRSAELKCTYIGVENYYKCSKVSHIKEFSPERIVSM